MLVSIALSQDVLTLPKDRVERLIGALGGEFVTGVVKAHMHAVRHHSGQEANSLFDPNKTYPCNPS